MKEDFIPVMVQMEDKKEKWFIDISRLSLSQLISLRNSMVGLDEMSVRCIDGIVYKNTSPENTYNRTIKKENKEMRRRIKRKNSSYERRKRKYD